VWSHTSILPNIFMAWHLVKVQNTSSWHGTWLSSGTNEAL